MGNFSKTFFNIYSDSSRHFTETFVLKYFKETYLDILIKTINDVFIYEMKKKLDR